MAPLQGLNGWQWIFIMQGVVCLPDHLVLL
jgi:hypothetical protein